LRRTGTMCRGKPPCTWPGSLRPWFRGTRLIGPVRLPRGPLGSRAARVQAGSDRATRRIGELRRTLAPYAGQPAVDAFLEESTPP
jgi:hypothetical protein